MNSEILLDAIGMVDDRFFMEIKQKRKPILPRGWAAVFAVMIMVVLSVGTAMAVSTEFRTLVFSVFQIGTTEQPPLEDPGAQTTQPGLNFIRIEDIDGEVKAHYFAGSGLVWSYEGGFYTCSPAEPGKAPEIGTFWEVRTDRVENVGAARVDFAFSYDDRDFRILFDYAAINGKLCVQPWPQDLNENPVGNGWNAEPIGNRTDVVLLSVPVQLAKDYTHDYFLLDLQTLETTDLLTGVSNESMIIDACQMTEDLGYMLLIGWDSENSRREYWLCDLKTNEISSLTLLMDKTVEDPYLLDDKTILFREPAEGGRHHIIRYDIPTQTQEIIMPDVTGYRGIRENGSDGIHGLVTYPDGSVDLINLRTGEILKLAGMETKSLVTAESPDGTRVMIAYKDVYNGEDSGGGYSKLGILNTQTGVLKLLNREVSGLEESFRGWLDNDSIVLTARSSDEDYYVYVYTFSAKQPD